MRYTPCCKALSAQWLDGRVGHSAGAGELLNAPVVSTGLWPTSPTGYRAVPTRCCACRVVPSCAATLLFCKVSVSRAATTRLSAGKCQQQARIAERNERKQNCDNWWWGRPLSSRSCSVHQDTFTHWTEGGTSVFMTSPVSEWPSCSIAAHRCWLICCLAAGCGCCDGGSNYHTAASGCRSTVGWAYKGTAAAASAAAGWPAASGRQWPHHCLGLLLAGRCAAAAACRCAAAWAAGGRAAAAATAAATVATGAVAWPLRGRRGHTCRRRRRKPTRAAGWLACCPSCSLRCCRRLRW